MPTFKLHQDSLQDKFQKSRAKIQLFGGGFANGKTTNVCIKTLEIAKDYPGANILMARSTYSFALGKFFISNQVLANGKSKLT